MDLSAVLAAIFGGLCVILGLILWSLKRSADGEVRKLPEEPMVDLVPSIAGLSYGELVGGNEVELVRNGCYFERLVADVAAARETVHFETFLWHPGRAADLLVGAFASAARRGIKVRILVDGSGAMMLGQKTERALKEAGCHFYRVRGGRWRTLGRQNNRDHRKIAIIDGRIGYVGGHCVTDRWLGDGEDPHHYCDISARICGPLVASLQSTFSENWMERSGALIHGTTVFPKWKPPFPGDVVGHIARMRPIGCPPAMRSLYYLAFSGAKHRIRVQNPYFLPDAEAIHLLCEAVEQGVDVQVMAPATSVSDMPMVQRAAHFRFDSLLRSGVRIFENQKTLIHQKVITVDGVWCAVGSANLDPRSFEINDEVIAGFADERLAREFEDIFEQDKQHCRECTLEEWRKRSRWDRFRSATCYLIKEQL
jgi:cardiolipin synthase A/B